MGLQKKEVAESLLSLKCVKYVWEMDVYVTVHSCYLKHQGTLWCTLRYPYLYISDFRIKEKINQTTTFHKWICNLTPEVTDTFKILQKRGELLLKGNFSCFQQYFCYLFLDFHVKAGTRFSVRDKRLFMISEVETTKVYSQLAFYINL